MLKLHFDAKGRPNQIEGIERAKTLGHTFTLIFSTRAAIRVTGWSCLKDDYRIISYQSAQMSGDPMSVLEIDEIA